jgi:hypothetical protein
VYELFERNITITPLAFDLTRRERLDFWRERMG